MCWMRLFTECGYSAKTTHLGKRIVFPLTIDYSAYTYSETRQLQGTLAMFWPSGKVHFSIPSMLLLNKINFNFFGKNLFPPKHWSSCKLAKNCYSNCTVYIEEKFFWNIHVLYFWIILHTPRPQRPSTTPPPVKNHCSIAKVAIVALCTGPPR